MNKKCCVLKCHNVGRHRFPKNEILRRKWIVAIKRRKYQPSWKPHSGSRICRNHFKKSDFVKTKKDGNPLNFHKLKPGTVPSVFVWSQTKSESSLTTKKETEIRKQISSTKFNNKAGNPLIPIKKSKSRPVASSRSSGFLLNTSMSKNYKKGKEESVSSEVSSNLEILKTNAKNVRRDENQDISNWEYRVIRKESLHLEEILGKIEYVFSLQDFNGRELEEKELEEIISSFPPLSPPNQILPLRQANRHSIKNLKA